MRLCFRTCFNPRKRGGSAWWCACGRCPADGRGGLGWALIAIVVDHLTVTRVAAGLGVSWHTANSAIIAEGRRRLIDNPARFDGVTTIGVDEHVW